MEAGTKEVTCPLQEVETPGIRIGGPSRVPLSSGPGGEDETVVSRALDQRKNFPDLFSVLYYFY